MARAPTLAVRSAVAITALAIAAFLPAYLPDVSMRSAGADTIFTVNSVGDDVDTGTGDGVCAAPPDGHCTLRAAIQEANALAGSDTIHFNLPPADGYIISPAYFLPVITDSLVIDATTQPGYSGQPLVELDGGNAASGLSVSPRLYNSRHVIRGLAISGFLIAGISIIGEGEAVIQGNIIAHNGGHGIILGASVGATISGNSIYDNAGMGIFRECLRAPLHPLRHPARSPRNNLR